MNISSKKISIILKIFYFLEKIKLFTSFKLIKSFTSVAWHGRNDCSFDIIKFTIVWWAMSSVRHLSTLVYFHSFLAKINFFRKSASICATIIPNPLLSIKESTHEIYKLCRLHNNNSCARPLDISLKSSLSPFLFSPSPQLALSSFLYTCAGTLPCKIFIIHKHLVPWLGVNNFLLRAKLPCASLLCNGLCAAPLFMHFHHKIKIVIHNASQDVKLHPKLLRSLGAARRWRRCFFHFHNLVSV